MIETVRLRLRPWSSGDLPPLAAMLSDAEVMHDMGRTETLTEAEERMARYQAQIERLGFGKWAVERRDDAGLIGFVGVGEIYPNWPIHPGLEIGWRLSRSSWGRGYASEAAEAAIRQAFEQSSAARIYSVTDETNARSRAVMERLGLTRLPALDHPHESTPGLTRVVHAAERAIWLQAPRSRAAFGAK